VNPDAGLYQPEAWETTSKVGTPPTWSRSRQELWTKGKTSGNVQVIKEIRIDCDNDAVIYKVEQVGGRLPHRSSQLFFQKIEGDKVVVTGEPVFDPKEVYKMDEKLKLGIPKGSLQNATIALFKRSGWRSMSTEEAIFRRSTTIPSTAPSAGPRRCHAMSKTAPWMRG
jgi:phosphoribosyl-AMP cyclohydrolase